MFESVKSKRVITTAKTETLMTVAISAISSGVLLITQANHFGGALCVAVGFGALVLRKYLEKKR